SYTVSALAALSNGAHSITATSADAAGNTSPASSALALTVDTIAPAVSSINRAGVSPIDAASVDFTVTFSEAVLNVDAADFALTTTGLTGASITSVTGSGATRTVTVNTGTGDGSIRLDLIASSTINDAAANSIGAAAYTAGQSYLIDKVPPVIVSVNRASADPATGSSVSWTITFSE